MPDKFLRSSLSHIMHAMGMDHIMRAMGMEMQLAPRYQHDPQMFKWLDSLSSCTHTHPECIHEYVCVYREKIKVSEMHKTYIHSPAAAVPSPNRVQLFLRPQRL